MCRKYLVCPRFFVIALLLQAVLRLALAVEADGKLLSAEEIARISTLMSARAEYNALMREKRERISSTVRGLAASDLQGRAPDIAAIEQDYSAREQAIFDKYGIARSEYLARSLVLFRHPEILRAYRQAGGVVPEPVPSEVPQTPEQRLAAAGIVIDPRSEDSIRSALEHADALLTGDVLKVLGNLGEAGAIPYLKPYLADDNPFQRAVAAGSLCRLGNDEGVPVLLDLYLDYRQPDLLRMQAFAGLTACPDSDAVNAGLLRAMRDDPNGYLRWQSAVVYQLHSDTSDNVKITPFIARLDQLREINAGEVLELTRITNDKTIRMLEIRKQELDEIAANERKSQQAVRKSTEFNNRPYEERRRLLEEHGGNTPF